jgi:uncharacterized protein (TIGR03435 family)
MIAVFAICVWAQNDTQAFEAASVKPNRSGSGDSSTQMRPGNVRISNEPLLRMIIMAYEVKDYQVEGPSWIRTEKYDVVAKAPVGTSETELGRMMRTLLLERFQLELHHETKESPVYGLEVVKGGFKLKPVEPAKGSSMNSTGNEKGGELKAQRADMARLARWLSVQMDRPVFDMTRIEGVYDFTLKYTKDSDRADADNVMRYPVLPLALQEQLGLRLEKRTAPIEMLVIDKADKVPIEN